MPKKTNKIQFKAVKNKPGSQPFTLDQLTLKNLFWACKMKVNDIIDQSHRAYFVQFLFNDEIYSNRIEALIGRIAVVEKEAALIDDLKDEKINRIKKQIQDTKEEWQQKREECPPIEFHATVTSVKWSGGKTAIDMTIPDATVTDINEKKALLSFYVASFEPDKTK